MIYVVAGLIVFVTETPIAIASILQQHVRLLLQVERFHVWTSFARA